MGPTERALMEAIERTARRGGDLRNADAAEHAAIIAGQRVLAHAIDKLAETITYTETWEGKWR